MHVQLGRSRSMTVAKAICAYRCSNTRDDIRFIEIGTVSRLCATCERKWAWNCQVRLVFPYAKRNFLFENWLRKLGSREYPIVFFFFLLLLKSQCYPTYKFRANWIFSFYSRFFNVIHLSCFLTIIIITVIVIVSSLLGVGLDDSHGSASLERGYYFRNGRIHRFPVNLFVEYEKMLARESDARSLFY